MVWQGNGMDAAWGRHAVCESSFTEHLQCPCRCRCLEVKVQIFTQENAVDLHSVVQSLNTRDDGQVKCIQQILPKT
jgi:hypothetical protein